jgi:AcrR family transcriptional regulator
VTQPAEIDGPPDPDTLPEYQRVRRQQIVQAALHLLQTGEYEDIQMRDVAERAGFAVGTVYRYFVSKEHLFAAVLLDWSQGLARNILKKPVEKTTPDAQLNELLGRVLSAFERKPQFLRLLIVIEVTDDPYARELHQRFGSGAHQMFRTALIDLEDDDAETVLDVVQSVMGAMLRVWAIGNMSMDDVRQRLSRTIAIVFSPPPRRRSAQARGRPRPAGDTNTSIPAARRPAR